MFYANGCVKSPSVTQFLTPKHAGACLRVCVVKDRAGAGAWSAPQTTETRATSPSPPRGVRCSRMWYGAEQLQPKALVLHTRSGSEEESEGVGGQEERGWRTVQSFFCFSGLKRTCASSQTREKIQRTPPPLRVAAFFDRTPLLVKDCVNTNNRRVLT